MSIEHEDSFRMIEERFRAGKPSELQKRKRRSSKRELVERLLPEIEGLLLEGYTLEGIAGYFVDIGLDMPVTTLKNYVTRARRVIAQSTKGRKKRGRSSNLSQGATRVAQLPGPGTVHLGPGEPSPAPTRPKTISPPKAAETAPSTEPAPLDPLSLEEIKVQSGGQTSSFAVPRRKRLDDL